MKTPICDFVKAYQESQTSRLHMPGHKGQNILGFESLDITEIKGADALYEADGIIAQSEENASKLFHTGKTLYSAEGSSLSIRTMIALAYKRKPLKNRPVLLAGRNAHKALLYACALLDIDIDWIMPNEEQVSICSVVVTPEQVKQKFEQADTLPIGLYITSPDYLGQMSDIKALAEVCKEYDVPLLVDNAHGAYLHFLPESQHPIDLGAYMSCDSAHKTLPVVTGGSYLHLSQQANQEVGPMAKASMMLFGSTSPSYLILQSLDRCNAYLDTSFRSELKALIQKLDQLKAELIQANIPVLPSEKTKVTIHASQMGIHGYELAERLRAHHAEPEFADSDFLVCMFTPQNRPIDFERLKQTLLETPHKQPLPSTQQALFQVKPTRKLSIRQAILSRQKFVPVNEAIGHICSEPSVSCPPAIPISVSGEIITKEMVDVLQTYDVQTIAIVEE